MGTSNSTHSSSTQLTRMDSSEATVPPKKASNDSDSGSSRTRVDSIPKRDSGRKSGAHDEAVTATYVEISKENPDSLAESEICKICGKVYTSPDIKHIPSGVAWLSFFCLFICCLWWLSWIPFIVDQKHCNICKKPVKVCPYCYRRIDRPFV